MLKIYFKVIRIILIAEIVEEIYVILEQGKFRKAKEDNYQ